MRPHRLAIAVIAIAPVLSTACRNREIAPVPTPAPAVPTETPVDPSIAERAAADARERAERERLERERMERERLAAERMRLMSATIYFDLDRSDLTTDARTALDAKLGVLASVPAMRMIAAPMSTTSLLPSAVPPRPSGTSCSAESMRSASRS